MAPQLLGSLPLMKTHLLMSVAMQIFLLKDAYTPDNSPKITPKPKKMFEEVAPGVVRLASDSDSDSDSKSKPKRKAKAKDYFSVPGEEMGWGDSDF